MNTVFIPELDHEEFVLQRPHELGSPDVVSLGEGLGTSDGPTLVWFEMFFFQPLEVPVLK